MRFFFTKRQKYSRRKRLGKEIFAVGLARKRTCTCFADKHCKPTREGSAVHSYATKFPLSGKRNFPYTEIFPLRCRAYRKRLSLPFGIDDSIAADYLCQQKSNEKWKAQNTFVQFVQFVVKKAILTPFLSGRGRG